MMALEKRDLDSLVSAFADEESLDGLKDIAIAMSKPGLTTKAATLPTFQEGLARIASRALHDHGENQLKALAVLGRLRQQAKVLSKQLQNALQDQLGAIQAPASALVDPLDRNYLAQMLQVLDFQGKEPYLANFISSEPPVKTEARQTATIALLQCQRSLSAVFALLGEAISERIVETADPQTTRARLLSRVLEAVTLGLTREEFKVDAGTGAAYAAFVQRSLRTVESAEAPAKEELGQNILLTLAGFIRPHFSLVREAQTFEAVHVAHRLFRPARWPRSTEKARDAIALLLREAVTLLAQIGITDNRLREILVLLTDQHVARGIFREIAEGTPGLSNDVVHWLETGQSISRLAAEDSVAENILEGVDRDIARCFREATSLALVKARLESELAELPPGVISEQVQALTQRVAQLITSCEIVATERGMQTHLHVGDIVEYSPTEHELEVPGSGSRIVRVTAPAVLRIQGGAKPRIVLKANVVPE